MTARLGAGRVVLGVAGGIAAYKAVEVCRRLVDAGVHVMPVLTDDAQRFVGALTFSALASEPARTSLFGGPEPIPHTRLGQNADLVVVAPATAKLIGKYAAGISDDLLTATLLATRAPVLVCPAMHTEMWEHPAVQENLATLAPARRARARARGGPPRRRRRRRRAGSPIPSASSPACSSSSRAPRRSRSSGRARARDRGRHPRADRPGPLRRQPVVGEDGPRDRGRGAPPRRAASCSSPPPRGRWPPGIEVVRVETAEQMRDAVLDARRATATSWSWPPRSPTSGRRRSRPRSSRRATACPRSCSSPPSTSSPSSAPRKRPGQVVVGFAAETERLHEHAAAKLAAKKVDLMVANDVSADDSGFEVDTNRALVLDAAGGVEALPLLTKDALADWLVERIAIALGTESGRRPPNISPTQGGDADRALGESRVEQAHVHVRVGHRRPPRQDGRPDQRQRPRRGARPKIPTGGSRARRS